VKLNKFYNYNDILEYIRKDPDPQYRFSPKVRSNWEINVPEIKDEPDFYAWKNNHLSCVVLRRIPSGNLNGYVVIPNNHPLYGNDGESLFAHGGVTLSKAGENWKGGELNLSHIINDDSWVFGFDTMHSGDLDPIYANKANHSYIRNTRSVYRNFTYVLKEVTELAEQIDNIKDSSSDK